MAPAFTTRSPRILFIDAYDSFANNIIALVQESLSAEVTTIRIDDKRFVKGDQECFLRLLKGFDAVIAGPGPGSVTNKKDEGIIGELWRLKDHDLLPVLGICLGFQSLAAHFGAKIERLSEPRHGIISEILHRGNSVFRGVGDVQATQYHSLQVNIGHSIQTRRSVSYPGELWRATHACPQLEPLAWDFDNTQNGAVLMAVRHLEKPFWGVQYHPESICTNTEGAKIVQNWWAEAQAWIREELLARKKDILLSQVNIDMPSYSLLRVAEACRVLGISTTEAAVLESGLNDELKPSAAGTGRYSIIGLFIPEETLRLHYYVSTHTLQLRTGTDEVYLETRVDAIWTYLKALVEHLKPLSDPPGPPFAPFWGGLMGYVSYEAGLDSIDVEPYPMKKDINRPDICFAYITRSIVFDHILKKIYVQSIRGKDMEWVEATIGLISQAVQSEIRTSLAWNSTVLATEAPVGQSFPSRKAYYEKILACQESISAGDSYELCLTEQTAIRLPRSPTQATIPWKLYRKLMTINSAPFGAYIRMGQDGHGFQIVSSSPERFISWDRNGSCQCRPIKGTVKKDPDITREDAEAILSTSKERAENLMIVDLVRHQLHGVYGAGNVQVKQLMEVEEYETVYQLVSVIEGSPPGIQMARTPEEWEDPPDYVSQKKRPEKSGIDVFAASIPPGSMTGAPKKRSCELLQDIEGNQPRGIYAGVLGYLDVGGGGDFSVVIRTMVKWEDEVEVVQLPDGSTREYDIWRIGAGGAITAQSTQMGEYEEMIVKLESTMRTFTPQPS
ncbi:para-aminobenzoate synthase [Glonium stellatum]|uniref:aminodeoxychorismate synthase n=1 Tax=Glonium stellatum TaxID=574774 RepID=A0A8E2EYH5_9PEZI|nr:para-aminobenzoate synthase [Glonium stellatum]